MEHDLRLGAVVLAAGAGARYSSQPGAKLLADLGGEPLLAHVLRRLRELQPLVTVVVLGHGADEIERTIDWAGELRIRNRDPGQGIASSLKAGIGMLEMIGGDLDGAFIVLGDQPRLSREVMLRLATAADRARPADRPIVVPVYRDEPGPRNPVLLLRPGWLLLPELVGDRGLATLIDRDPHLVLHVPVAGAMPDIDEPADLAALPSPACDHLGS